MEAFIATRLHAVEFCCICTEPFDSTHHPVALPCKHIVGYSCITRWLRRGRGNTTSCPHCRHSLFKPPRFESRFDALSVWEALLVQPSERLHAFMQRVLMRLEKLWRRKPDGDFKVTEMLEEVVFPALQQTVLPEEHLQQGESDAFADCCELIELCWDSVSRPNSAHGLAVPLVRLARLTSSVSSVLSKWLTSFPLTTQLIWAANACLSIEEENISWDMIATAAKQENEQYFPLLHLYTVLISQSIHLPFAQQPMRRHEIMNLTVEQCCARIGGKYWDGRPSNEFKDLLVCVYGELQRHQLEKNRPGLRGRKREEHVVRGLWAMSAWGAK